MNWIDTNILISICTCAISLTQFLFWRYIAKQKSYEAEKGKNLATKEDIKDITDKVESVKASYNESLERHKIELQKEYYSSQYMIDLCNKIDTELIEKMAKCRPIVNDIMKEYVSFERGDVFGEIEPIYDHLIKYETRYANNEAVKKIISNYLDYQDLENRILEFETTDFEGEVYGCISGAMEGIEKLLSEFLPPLETKIKPEH